MTTALDHHLCRLRCPVSGQTLHRDNGRLVDENGLFAYDLTADEIPLFAPAPPRAESRAQQAHYDRIAGVYIRNLTEPHTQEYSAFFDRLLLEAIPPGPLGLVGEICCGRGEAMRLLAGRLDVGAIGIDISQGMLATATADLSDDHCLFVQGDATGLPLADAVFDHVFVLGGIHHVNDRPRMFAEIHRVLKPGGCFFWREPLDDFFGWRWLRAAIYRLSNTLDADTERPLRSADTHRQLAEAGLEVVRWEPCGLLGFCLFMNSDVLVVNRLWRHLPGIRRLTRAFVALDQWLLRLPGLRHAGLQVVGKAKKATSH
jgi:ubiquinone/menaquinone biosynthesis C-methylase UbiE